MFLRRLVTAHPTEVAAAIVMIVVGIFVTVLADGAEEQQRLVAAGGILTATGGALLSWVTSRMLTQQQADAELRERLGSLSRSIGQAASQIRLAAAQGIMHEIHPATGFALVEQASWTIYGQVSEMALIQGAPFDAGFIAETAEKLNRLARDLTNTDKSKVELARQEIERISDDLRDRAVTATYEVSCPSCGAANLVSLARASGSSAMVTCGTCQQTFNAHTGPNGAFTRPRGPLTLPSSIAPADWAFKCPDCEHELKARSSHMMCVSCYAYLELDLASKSVRSIGKYECSDVLPEGRTGARPILRCPMCRRLMNGLINDGLYYMAFCRDDRQLMRVSHEAWQTWRARNAPAGSPPLTPG
ncbi:MAG: hypothetical protein AB7F65_10960 [Dehalococcoidia bacterium]